MVAVSCRTSIHPWMPQSRRRVMPPVGSCGRMRRERATCRQSSDEEAGDKGPY
jgi:hypothetical protein